MSLIQKIKTDTLEARKARDTRRAILLSTLYAEAARVGKDAGNRESTDEETLKVIRRFIKNLDQIIETNLKIKDGFVPANIAAAPYLAERALLMPYLPVESDELVLDWRAIADKLWQAEENNDKVEALYGRPQNIGWFTGQVLKETRGKAPKPEVDAYFQELLRGL